MPAPSEALGTMRPDLGDGLAEFDLTGNRELFIGHGVLPILPVVEQGGPYPIIPIEQLLQSRNTERASGAPYGRGTYDFKKGSFATAEHGWEEVVDDRNRTIYRNWGDQELYAAARALDFVMRNAEIRIATAIFNATTWTGSALTTGITHEWDDLANAVPVTDVNAAKRKVWAGCGIWPNTLVINRNVFMNLRACAQIQALIHSSGAGGSIAAGDITVQQLAQVFDLDRILVAGGAKNSANEGQSVSIANIWSDEYAMVCKTAVSGDQLEPCVGRTLHWSEDGSSPEGTVESYYEKNVRGEIIRVRHEVEEKIVMPEAGHLLSNVTT